MIISGNSRNIGIALPNHKINNAIKLVKKINVHGREINVYKRGVDDIGKSSSFSKEVNKDE